MKYPLSHNAGKPLRKFFYDILTFHVPPGPDVRILDPTCGKRYLWEHFNQKSLRTGKQLIDNYGIVIFGDIRDFGQLWVRDFRDFKFNHELDAIVFDPPYLFGYEGSKDPRADDYGDYDQTYAELSNLVLAANELFPEWLKPGGKLIFKCSDQYQTKERKFYPHHIEWAKSFDNFNLIDFFIYIHHRMSPTAFQVKDRPCSVIMHTYFMVFEVE